MNFVSDCEREMERMVNCTSDILILKALQVSDCSVYMLESSENAENVV